MPAGIPGYSIYGLGLPVSNRALCPDRMKKAFASVLRKDKYALEMGVQSINTAVDTSRNLARKFAGFLTSNNMPVPEKPDIQREPEVCDGHNIDMEYLYMRWIGDSYNSHYHNP